MNILSLEGYLPNHKERITSEVPALYNALVILQHDLDECSEIGTHDRRIQVHGSTTWVIGDASNTKDASDLVVVCELKRCISQNKRYAVDCISLLAIELTRCVS